MCIKCIIGIPFHFDCCLAIFVTVLLMCKQGHYTKNTMLLVVFWLRFACFPLTRSSRWINSLFPNIPPGIPFVLTAVAFVLVYYRCVGAN